MKIVHITWDDIGGVGQMCLSLQKSFIEMGHESKIIVLKSDPLFLSNNHPVLCQLVFL
jgi:hypothetical protein